MARKKMMAISILNARRASNASENLKNLKQKKAELTHNARTHHLCTYGAMLDKTIIEEHSGTANKIIIQHNYFVKFRCLAK